MKRLTLSIAIVLYAALAHATNLNIEHEREHDLKTERRVKRNYIPRHEPSYSFDEIVLAYETLGEARSFGFVYQEYQPTACEVFRKNITRTRRHPEGTITLPIYVAANLTYDSKRCTGPRTFTPEVQNYLRKCGLRGGTSPDDRGHLVAFTLGGKNDMHNLVPMAKDLNRIQGIWYYHENQARDFLDKNRGGMVYWEVLLVYFSRDTEPYRPVGFARRYTKYPDKTYLANGIPRLEVFYNENDDYRNSRGTFGLKDFAPNTD